MNFDFLSGEILLFDKPYGWTSFDVVNKVRYLIRKRLGIKKIKVGHTGTLDPLATGLLVLCTGKFTKRIPLLQNDDKEYSGTMFIGATTPSLDKETEVSETFDISHITGDDIFKATKNFLGETEQVPPLYSAVKVAGKRSYDYARGNEKINLKPRKVNIYEFEILSVNLPEISFRVKCGKGTYIRSLVRDFGKELGAGAYLTSLCRTASGQYRLDDAMKVEDFEKLISGQES